MRSWRGGARTGFTRATAPFGRLEASARRIRIYSKGVRVVFVEPFEAERTDVQTVRIRTRLTHHRVIPVLSDGTEAATIFTTFEPDSIATGLSSLGWAVEVP